MGHFSRTDGFGDFLRAIWTESFLEDHWDSLEKHYYFGFVRSITMFFITLDVMFVNLVMLG